MLLSLNNWFIQTRLTMSDSKSLYFNGKLLSDLRKITENLRSLRAKTDFNYSVYAFHIRVKLVFISTGKHAKEDKYVALTMEQWKLN